MAVVWTPHRTAADPVDDFSFDIYAQGGTIEVWVDISQLVTESNWDQLEDGADIAFELNFSLTTPRRLIGEAEVASNEQAIKLSYHVVTETYYCAFSRSRFESPSSFAARVGLNEFLADSLLFTMAELDELDDDKRYVLKISITRVSVASLSRYTNEADDSNSDSPLSPLFQAFLDLTQFGRQEFEARSRPLTLDELSE